MGGGGLGNSSSPGPEAWVVFIVSVCAPLVVSVFVVVVVPGGGSYVPVMTDEKGGWNGGGKGKDCRI